MIDHGTLLSIPFLKKSRFTGSDRGMRYSIYKVEETRVIPNEDASNDASEEAPKEEKVTLLEAAACPGPFSVDFTKPELFTKKRFSFDDEGRAAAVDWLNELYEEKREFLRMFIIIQINIIKSIIKRMNKKVCMARHLHIYQNVV